MSTEEEVKWLSKRYTWKYIPNRYQALVACIVSGFLYFNIFNVCSVTAALATVAHSFDQSLTRSPTPLDGYGILLGATT